MGGGSESFESVLSVLIFFVLFKAVFWLLNE